MMGERAAGDDRAERRAQAFCRRQNLGAGAIELSRAGEINGGPHGAGPVGRCGGPATEAVERQIEAIEQFVRELT